jgi:hypothetical protein
MLDLWGKFFPKLTIFFFTKNQPAYFYKQEPVSQPTPPPQKKKENKQITVTVKFYANETVEITSQALSEPIFHTPPPDSLMQYS